MKSKYLLILLILISFSGCKDYLDIVPKGKLIPTTVEDYENMLNDMTVVSYGDYFNDLLTDDVFFPEENPGALFSRQPLHARRIYTFKKQVFDPGSNDFLWTETYKRIFYFNSVANDIMKAVDGTESNKKSVRAEALFGRALEHLLLVNVYARHYDPATAATDPGVPLVLVADISAKHRRNTVKEVYDQIILDLEEAVKSLPANSKITKFRTNKAAGYALLSRVYLYMGDYAKALDYANQTLALYSTLVDMNTFKIVTPGPFPNVPGSPVGWTDIPDGKKHPEAIVARHFLRPFGLGNVACASPELSALFDNNDQRWTLYYANAWPPLPPPVDYWTRYKVRIYLRGDYYNNALGTPEVYLTRAECKARANDKQGALDDVNKLRKNRIVPAAYRDFTLADFNNDQEKVLRFVLDERRRELAFMGTRVADLKRLNKDPKFAKVIRHTAEGKEYVLQPNTDDYLRQIYPDAAKFNPDWVLN
ncbi:RagB/SusD family nutrient uptake outer membrane protein [Pedobacter hiemivivus]|uniref:RagB/SusD family nutrient uptake outer membrane protein n=1 Tax=Pedobacter hiemivivus TaxID=2530454 RepID=A0A4R0MMC7_9SPHI|nr:RagB/SusD family nutrient uptake outer membrane protein [Pedobacter hiemivivus]TCC87879.1 RagB/SusD family nutrient uptake outer membrane protein [Pedobacter hiemivivus]